jgi:signal transduction histidine kinase
VSPGLVALLGWVLAGAAAGLAAVLWRRLRLVGQAEHELRGPVTVLCLAGQRLRRDPAARRYARVLESELERLRQGLEDLAAARHGGRACAGAAATPAPLERMARSALAGWTPALGRRGRRARIDWRAGPAPVALSRGRLAQALGNLLANAVEHGRGTVELRGRRTPGGVRVEVRSEPGRGQGLAIAARAVEEAGGRLELKAEPHATIAALDLPTAHGETPPAA